jgi:hypothetical protein
VARSLIENAELGAFSDNFDARQITPLHRKPIHCQINPFDQQFDDPPAFTGAAKTSFMKKCDKDAVG